MSATITARMFRGYPDLLTARHIQDILHIGRSKAYALLRSGELRALRIGSKYLIPKAYLVDFMRKKS